MDSPLSDTKKIFTSENSER